jgi:hypothetical protein
MVARNAACCAREEAEVLLTATGVRTTAITSCAYPCMRLRLMMIITILTIFQSHWCDSGFFCLISPVTPLSPPPPPPPPPFHPLPLPFPTELEVQISHAPHSHRTPLLSRPHVACVTHVPGGIFFLIFVAIFVVAGLLLCRVYKKKRNPTQNSEKIIEPTSAPLNIEMTTASGGEAALPGTTSEEVQIV